MQSQVVAPVGTLDEQGHHENCQCSESLPAELSGLKASHNAP